MAVNRCQDTTMNVPNFEEIDRNRLRWDYDPLGDSLWVGLTPEPRPAINVYVDDDTMFLVDPDTNDVVGIELEHFLARALRPRDTME